MNHRLRRPVDDLACTRSKVVLRFVLGLILLPHSLPAAGDRYEIDRPTLDRWSAPYRGWHYWPDHVIPARPVIGSITNLVGTDVPTVYQLPGRDKYFMSFIGFDGQGYKSFVAESEDLLHWKNFRLAMGFGPTNEFDHGGCVIGAFLYETYDIKAPRLIEDSTRASSGRFTARIRDRVAMNCAPATRAWR